MSTPLIPIGFVLLAALYTGMGLIVRGKRPRPVATSFAWMMLSIAAWSLGYGLELLAPGLTGKLMWARVEMFGISSVAVFLFSFSAAYTGRGSLLSPRNKILLAIIPSITVVLTWIPQYRFLIWETITIGQTGLLTYLATDFGYWFWLQTAYNYALTLLASVFLLLEVFRSPRPYNIQAGIVLLGVLFPWTGSILYLSRSVLAGIDLSPFAFLPTALLLLWGILRYRLLDMWPMAPSVILEALEDAIVVVDARKQILYLNKLAEQLLRTQADKAIGQPIVSVRPSCLDTINRLFDRQENFIEQVFELNGQDRFFEIRITELSTKERAGASEYTGHMITFRDVHQRKQFEMNLQRREAIMGALNLAAQRFLRSTAWETNIPEFLERIGQATGVGRSYLFQNYERQDGKLFTSLCYEWTAPGIAPQIDDPAFRQIPVQKIGPASWHVELSQERLVTALIRDLPADSQSGFVERGVRSTVIVPIFVERRWWGSLGLEDFASERLWNKGMLDALQAAAEILRASEMRSRNENILHRRQRTLNLLHEIVAAALQTTDRRSMAQTIVNYLGDLLNTDGCYLSVWDEPSETFTPLAAYGLYSKAYLSLTLEPGESTLTTSALAAGHTLIINDLSNTPHLSPRIAALLPFRSAMILPLIAGQKKLGAILFTYSNSHQFHHEEISVGEQAAGLLALTLEKFDAIEEARKRAEEAEMLRKAGAAVAATLHSGEAISRILEQLSVVIPYDSASVQLLRGNELEIVGGHGWDHPEGVLGLRFSIPGDNPNSVVMETGKPYLLADTKKAYSSFREGDFHSHIHSWLGVPLIVRGQVIGLLTVDSKQTNYFKPHHVKTVTTFADQVSIALENARLFEEVQNLALTDVLTGLYNRRGLFEIGHIEFARTRRLERPFSLIMMDIDHFKPINDTYGHPTGDQVLQFLASELRNMIREADIVGRYGGEEFAILLSGSDGKAALELAERVRATIETTPFYVGENQIRITLSLGVAEYNENSPNLETLVARADQALYVAKHLGRNRVALGK